jgi:hypothetical protein
MDENYGIPEGRVALTAQEISKIGIKLVVIKYAACYNQHGESGGKKPVIEIAN